MSIKVKWGEVANNLRRYKPLAQVATEVGMDAATLQRIARGETEEPKHMAGTRLLDLHLDQCRDRHQQIFITL